MPWHFPCRLGKLYYSSPNLLGQVHICAATVSSMRSRFVPEFIHEPDPKIYRTLLEFPPRTLRAGHTRMSCKLEAAKSTTNSHICEPHALGLSQLYDFNLVSSIKSLARVLLLIRREFRNMKSRQITKHVKSNGEL